MRSIEIIAETPKENKDLISLAYSVLQNWRKNPRREVSLNDINLSDIIEPNVKELAKFVKVKFDPQFASSMYNTRSKEILIKNDKDKTDYELRSIIVHELQHALDDFKSQGRFRKEKGDYWFRQSEVNARLSQVIHDVEEALEELQLKKINWRSPKLKNKVLKIINSYLALNRLTPKQGLEEKRYQRLLNRIYQYLINR